MDTNENFETDGLFWEEVIKAKPNLTINVLKIP